MFGLGPTEIIVILLIALLIFGPRKLPELGRSLGQGIREFRSGSKALKDDLALGLGEEPAHRAPAAQDVTAAPTGDTQARDAV